MLYFDNYHGYDLLTNTGTRLKRGISGIKVEGTCKLGGKSLPGYFADSRTEEQGAMPASLPIASFTTGCDEGNIPVRQEY